YEYGTAAFEFTVPGTDVATNAWQHSWEIVFTWQTQGYTYVRYYQAWEEVADCNGVMDTFHLDAAPVVPDSEHLFLVNWGTETISPVTNTAYDLDDATGTVEFDTPPAAGNTLYAQYTYAEYCGTGDGYNTVFWLDESPIKPDSEIVLLYDDITGNIARTTDYTIDDDTGKIVFTTAPLPYQTVYASYEVYGTSEWYTTWGDSNFVVLSADQAEVRLLGIQYEQMWYYFEPDCVAAENYAATAEAHEDNAEDAWYRGDFATAKTEMQAAIAALQQAKDAELAFDQAWEDRDVAWDEAYLAEQEAETAWDEANAAYVEAQTNALNQTLEAEKELLEARAKEAKGHGAMWSNLGVFTILLGVGVLLAGIAGILWAFSRYVAAKGPKQAM
ncbi:MAG: hypothetical protein QUS33_06970, partial [Dehalococcoidia bacterium]|nr:hypothetical protein [Dehalococcoidia bacterium]